MKKQKITVSRYNDDWLIRRLKSDSNELKKYIEHTFKEYEKDRDLDLLLDCLKIAVIASKGAATNIAKTANIDRSGIYKALSNHTKPRIDTFLSILNGIGFSITFTKLKKAA